MAGGERGRRGEWVAIAFAATRRALRAFRGESVPLRAMALAYLSLLSVVPALVVAFSVLQAVTGRDRLWGRLNAVVLDNLAVGARASIEPHLERFVRNAHAAGAGAGAVGALLLVWSLVVLFGTVEAAVNDIWAIRRRRPLAPRLVLYVAGLTLGPLLLAASVTLGHRASEALGASTAADVLVRVASVLLSCALFALLYVLVPATKVRLAPALAGGAVAGIAWELAKWGYTEAVSRFFHYHAIYGSLAAVPTFMLWLYVSWTLFLLGARVAFVLQHARALLRAHGADGSPLGRELLAARVLLDLAAAARRGAPPVDPADIAMRLEVHGEVVREALAALRQGGLVAESEAGGYVTARPPSSLTLGDVRRVVAGAVPNVPETMEGAVVAGILAGAEGEAAQALEGVSLDELCRRVEEAESARSAERQTAAK